MFDSIIAWVESVLGTYTPVTYEVTKIIGESEITEEIVAQGIAGVDWRYVFTGLFLLVTVYSVFRLLGVLLERIGGK